MLTMLKIKNVKASGSGKPQKLSDSGGMYLYVSPTGGKSFRLDYRFAGKRKTLTLGKYPALSLLEARAKAAEAKSCLVSQIDPNSLKRQKKLGTKVNSQNTFTVVANDWFDLHMSNKSDSHKVRTRRLLDNDLIPPLGTRPIKDITPQELLCALRIVEIRTVDIAHRCLETAGMVYKYAIASGLVETNAALNLKGALKAKTIENYPAITDPKKLGIFLKSADEYCGSLVVKSALRITPLLFQRPHQIRGMKWSEINWEQKQWEIPAARMKMSNNHIVPLSSQALAIIEALRPITSGSEYVFTSMRGKSKPLSDNGVRTALRTMGYSNEDVVPHGFRATARTLLDEELNFRPDWIEQQLAHAVKDPLGRAYNRTTFLADRRIMMQKWADYLDTLKVAEASAKSKDDTGV
jgi:integrase